MTIETTTPIPTMGVNSTGNQNASAGRDFTNCVLNFGGVVIFAKDGDTAEVLAAQLTQAVQKLQITPSLSTIGGEQQADLFLILRQIKLPKADLLSLYQACLPRSAFVGSPQTLWEILTILCSFGMQAPKNRLPIFEFAERLALHEAAKEFAMPLRAWVEANAPPVKPVVPISEINRPYNALIAEQKQAATDDFSYLQIYLEPDLFNRTQQRKQPLFKVELVLWRAGSDDPFVLHVAEAAGKGNEHSGLWRLDDLPLLLDQVFANHDYVARIPDITRLVIEIVVPSDWVCYGFEHWPHNDEFTLGMLYPLVVRLQDRFTIPNPADQARANASWKKKWTFFAQKLSNNGCDGFHWLSKGALEDRRLTLLNLWRQNEVACISIAMALAGDKRDVFEILRDAGIPIALWLRGEHPDHATLSDLKEKILPLLHDKKLNELRDAVHDLRSSEDALQNSAFIGNFLSLLWDDPNRPPYKYAEQGVFQ